MPAIPTPNMGLAHAWNFRESGWNTDMDNNLIQLGALLQAAVLDKDLSEPPETPEVGDRYLVGASATLDWADHDGDLALWDGDAWRFYAPAEGWLCWLADENKLYAYDGAAWTEFSAATGGPYLPLSGGTMSGEITAPGGMGLFWATHSHLRELSGSVNLSGSGLVKIFVGGVQRAGFGTAAFTPGSTGGLTLGTDSIRWGTLYGNVADFADNILMVAEKFLALSGSTANSGVWARGASGYAILNGGTGVQLRANGATLVTVVAATTTIANKLVATGNVELGDAVGDDVYLLGLARGLVHGEHWSIAGASSAGDYSWIAPGAGSLILAHGTLDYSSPGDPVQIKKNGSEWTKVGGGGLADSSNNKFCSKAAKGVFTFAAGDVITVHTTTSATNLEIRLAFIVDTYANTTTGDLEADSGA